MNISGILILDKPVGKSSAFIARLIGKKIGAKKVGHLGTLDPFATGVLPIAINDATKLIKYIKAKQKTYVFEMVFGQKTNTSDVTGQIIETSDNIPNQQKIANHLRNFVGETEQIPSSFSAIKIQGQKACELARKGEIPNIKKRKITVFSLKYLEQTTENSHIIEASVSPGTYIRTLAEDIASSLNSAAYVKTLKRTQDGIFSLRNAITMDELEKNNYNINHVLCQLEDVLDDIPVIFISSQKIVEDLRNGRTAIIPTHPDGLVAVASTDGFFAIVELNDSVAHPRRIIRQCY